jgi:serine/threonine protein kinase
MTTETTESPRKLGRYELVHLLGQGGMGEVYLAKITGAAGFEKPCIVKTILPALLKDGQFLDRFHHEAKVLVHLVHSSIAQVYDMGEAHGTYYMALEYVAGVDVAYLADQARNQGQAIPPAVALYLGQRMAEGLGYAHRKAGPDGTPLGIVHRDVSPHNVMVSYEGEVKVIDFGLAKSAARSKYTLPATVMGKLGYMSPEQARAEALDHRSDIYSCGVVVWELLAGRPLVAHGTVGEMMAAMANPTVPALHELRPDVDAALDAVVRRALAPHPQERYGRADEFARALNEQLLRSSASLGAEEVGNFVKALCPEAFSAQRKLISRISGGSRSPAAPLHTGGVAVASALPPGMEAMTGLDATSMRPLSEAQADSASAPIRPVVSPVPGALAPAAALAPEAPAHAATLVPQAGGTLVPGPTGVALPPAQAAVHAAQAASLVASENQLRRWKTVALVLGALVLVGATFVGTVLFMRGRGPAPGAVAQGPGGPHEPRGPRQFEPARPPPPHLGGPAHDGHPPPHPGGPLPPRPPPPPEAPNVQVAAAAGAEGSAAAVPAVVKVPAEPERPRAREPQWIAVKGAVLPVLSRDGKYVVPRGTMAGLRLGKPVKVVGPQREDGRRQVLGFAIPLKPLVRKGGGMLVSLDEEATASSPERFVVVPEVEPAPQPVAVTPAPQPEVEPDKLELPVPQPEPVARKLGGGVKRSSFLNMGGIDKGLIIRNAEDAAWFDCKATLSGKRRYELRVVPKKAETKVDEDSFKVHADAPKVAKDELHLECDEGVALFKIQG